MKYCMVPEPGNNIFKYLIESKKIATKGIEDLCGHLNHVVMWSVSLQSDLFVCQAVHKMRAACHQ